MGDLLMPNGMQYQQSGIYADPRIESTHPPVAAAQGKSLPHRNPTHHI